MGLKRFVKSRCSVDIVFFENPYISKKSVSQFSNTVREQIVALCINSLEIYTIDENSDLSKYLKMVPLSKRIKDLDITNKYNAILFMTPNIDDRKEMYNKVVCSSLSNPELNFKIIFDKYEELIENIKCNGLPFNSKNSHIQSIIREKIDKRDQEFYENRNKYVRDLVMESINNSETSIKNSSSFKDEE